MIDAIAVIVTGDIAADDRGGTVIVDPLTPVVADGVVGDIVRTATRPEAASAVVAQGTVIDIDGDVGGFDGIVESAPAGVFDGRVAQRRAAQVVSAGVKAGASRDVVEGDGRPVDSARRCPSL